MSVKDESKVDEVIAALRELESKYIEVGILEKNMKDKHGDATLGEIATVHEFGYTGTDKRGRKMNIPERSFIRSSFDKHEKDVRRLGEQYIDEVVALKMKPDDLFKAMGTDGASKTQQYIRNMTSPPLASSTIKQKGSSKLLIDTGRLIGAIDYEVK